MNWPPLIFTSPPAPVEKMRHERRMKELREMDVDAWVSRLYKNSQSHTTFNTDDSSRSDLDRVEDFILYGDSDALEVGGEPIGTPKNVSISVSPTIMDHEPEVKNDGPELIADRKRLAVDFDNTLTTDDVRYWDGERPMPEPDAVARVREHYHAGGTVIVWTARPWSEANHIAAHLTEWEDPYHGIRCEKGSADVYLDDKAIAPEEVF